MKRLFILISCLAVLLSSCGQQSNSAQSNATSTEGSKSQIQSDVSTPDVEDVQIRQVLIKRTEYDGANNIIGWREYNYDTENQAEWREYNSSGELLKRGIEKYDEDWNLVENLEYNKYDILTLEEKFKANGDYLYSAYYSENGTLENEHSYTYNDDGTKDSETTYRKRSDNSEAKYTIKSIYNEKGVLLREIWEYLDAGETWNYRLYSHDEHNRIVEMSSYMSDSSLGGKYFYQYDENDKIIEIRCEDSLPDWSYITTYAYDKLNNCVKEQTIYSGRHEYDSLITSVYDENGFILQETHEKSEGTWYYLYEYDMIPVVR